MTPIEFSAWLNGINAGLCGALPHRAIWTMVMQEAAKLAVPRDMKLPLPGSIEHARDTWWDKRPSPSDASPWTPPFTVTCSVNEPFPNHGARK